MLADNEAKSLVIFEIPTDRLDSFLQEVGKIASSAGAEIKVIPEIPDDFQFTEQITDDSGEEVEMITDNTVNAFAALIGYSTKGLKGKFHSFATHCDYDDSPHKAYQQSYNDEKKGHTSFVGVTPEHFAYLLGKMMPNHVGERTEALFNEFYTNFELKKSKTKMNNQ